MRRPTIKDVARRAGVSPATVSYVMNDMGKVTEEVARLVRRAARDLGYSRSRAAVALKTGRHDTIGCLLPTLLSPVFPLIANAVQGRAEELGLSTLLIDTGDSPESEAGALLKLAQHGVDGVIAVLNAPPPPGLPFPVVTVDAAFAGHDSIRCDHFAGGREAARIAARLGHRRVGLLYGLLSVASSVERRAGFLAGVEEAGLELLWEVEVPLGTDLNPEARRAMAGRDVSLVACVNDMVAIGAMSAARDLGLSVPQDVSILGFDDMPMAGWSLIDLSTIHQPCRTLGQSAVDLLMQRVSRPDAPVAEVILPVRPLLRATTAPHQDFLA